MHILFLSDNFYPEYNAAATRVYERARYWVKWGHQVTVITSVPNFPMGKVFPGYQNKWHQVEMMEGIRVVRVKTFITPNRGRFLRILDFMSYMFAAFFAGIFVRKPDVIVATSPQFFTAIAGYGLSLLKWKSFVFEVADLWPASIVAVGAMKFSFWTCLLEKVELFLYRHSKSVIALTYAFKKDIVARRITADKISVILNGVELSQYSPREKKPSLLKQYHLENCFVVGYIGNHGMAQDLRNVLRTAKLFKQEKNVRFLLVGDGAEKQELMRYATAHHLNNVIFVPPQSKNEISDFWSLCDVALVHLKKADVFKTVIPSKIFEAMAMGLPILLVSPKGEAAELIEKQKVGEWVPAGDPVLLANAIQHLQVNRQPYIERAKAIVSHYTREAQAKRYLQVLMTSAGE